MIIPLNYNSGIAFGAKLPKTIVGMPLEQFTELVNRAAIQSGNGKKTVKAKQLAKNSSSLFTNLSASSKNARFVVSQEGADLIRQDYGTMNPRKFRIALRKLGEHDHTGDFSRIV